MRVIRGFGPPGDSDVPAGDSHEYATWDAAYVLGSLSPADRREFEAHLSVCPSCTQAVAELSGMPALLSKLDSDTVASIDDHTASPRWRRTCCRRCCPQCAGGGAARAW